MVKKRKIASVLLAAGTVAGLLYPSGSTAYAATKEKIESVSLTVNAEVEPGPILDDENIQVTIPSSANYILSEFELDTESMSGFTWAATDIPILKVVLEAEDNHYFALTKASSVKLKGDANPEYKTGNKKSNSTKLELEIALNCLQNAVGELEDVEWLMDTPGIATWLSNAQNSHEVRITFNGDTRRTIHKIPAGSSNADLRPYMLTPGEYSFEVREYSEAGGKRGEWVESNKAVLSETAAESNRDRFAYTSQGGYGWSQQGDFWVYTTPGGNVKNNWLDVNGVWYYFDENGYCVTGWREIAGVWYYFDDDCSLLTSCITPDGHTVDANGAWDGNAPVAVDAALMAQQRAQAKAEKAARMAAEDEVLNAELAEFEQRVTAALEGKSLDGPASQQNVEKNDGPSSQ